MADSLCAEGGEAAMQLRIGEQYVDQFGNLAQTGNTFVVSANLTDLASMIALAGGALRASAGSGLGATSESR